jgi:hypothetical protein
VRSRLRYDQAFHDDLALNSEVAALAEGCEVPPAAVGLHAVQVVDGEDPPAGFDTLAVTDDDCCFASQVVLETLDLGTVVGPITQADDPAVRTAAVAEAPLAGALHVRVAAADAAMPRLFADEVLDPWPAIDLVPRERITVAAALKGFEEAQVLAHDAPFVCITEA